MPLLDLDLEQDWHDGSCLDLRSEGFGSTNGFFIIKVYLYDTVKANIVKKPISIFINGDGPANRMGY